MTGLVLAGGQSQRMGQNKALLCYQELPQYKVVAKLLQPFCSEVWISSATNLDPNYMHIPDDLQYENVGPTAGLLSAFLKKQADIFVLAIDYPFLTPADIAVLFQNYQTNLCTTVLYNPDTYFYEPYLGIYTQTDLISIATSITTTINFSLQKWLVANKILPSILSDYTHLQSIDTIEQYEVATRNKI